MIRTGASSGGEDQHADYWHRVSFGISPRRPKPGRPCCKRIVPRLKIADQCRFDGRFLVVTGKLREYKIHLGSGNVLMSPNDRYLCIVQKRGSGTKQTEASICHSKATATLTMILSKAFLLAGDDKIKEPTIRQQTQLA